MFSTLLQVQAHHLMHNITFCETFSEYIWVSQSAFRIGKTVFISYNGSV